MNPNDFLLIAEALARGELRGRGGRPAHSDLRKREAPLRLTSYRSGSTCTSCPEPITAANALSRACRPYR